MQLKKHQEAGGHGGSCCADVFGEEGDQNSGLQSTVPESMKAFGALLTSVTATGKVDKRVKELIIFSLVLTQRCEACVHMHYDKALGMGITKEELDEAAWCAVLIGGAPVKMFYSRYLDSRKGKVS